MTNQAAEVGLIIFYLEKKIGKSRIEKEVI